MKEENKFPPLYRIYDYAGGGYATNACLYLSGFTYKDIHGNEVLIRQIPDYKFGRSTDLSCGYALAEDAIDCSALRILHVDPFGLDDTNPIEVIEVAEGVLADGDRILWDSLKDNFTAEEVTGKPDPDTGNFDANGNIIIKAEHGWFKLDENNPNNSFHTVGVGVLNVSGKLIIPTEYCKIIRTADGFNAYKKYGTKHINPDDWTSDYVVDEEKCVVEYFDIQGNKIEK